MRERRAAGALPPSLPHAFPRRPLTSGGARPQRTGRCPGPGRLRPPPQVVRKGGERERKREGGVTVPAPAGRSALPLAAAGRPAACCPRRLLPPPRPFRSHLPLSTCLSSERRRGAGGKAGRLLLRGKDKQGAAWLLQRAPKPSAGDVWGGS